jgi:hypothetical protein
MTVVVDGDPAADSFRETFLRDAFLFIPAFIDAIL